MGGAVVALTVLVTVTGGSVSVVVERVAVVVLEDGEVVEVVVVEVGGPVPYVWLLRVRTKLLMSVAA